MKVYVDIETTDIVPCAGIWEIGAICVRLNGDVQEFLQPCKPTGTVLQSTIDWINSKPDVAQRYNEALSSPYTDEQAARMLWSWLHEMRGGTEPNREQETLFSWGTFDFPILGALYDKVHCNRPWHYGSECDLRSVAKFLNSPTRPDTSAHHALEDAKALLKCHKELLK